jgi:inositol phosphorylceramide mannosyltransferase catalytic subunit
MIPRRIIQTGKTTKLSLLEQAASANLKNLNPGFEYVYFDDQRLDDFVGSEFPEYASTIRQFPQPIQRIDFFRYLAVYRLGGFYFDLDVVLAHSISDLTVCNCVFPFEELTLSRHLRTRHKIDWEIGNYAFGAAPGHPFLRAIIENCVRGLNDPNWLAPMMDGIPLWFRSGFDVLNSTGPGLVTRTLAENSDIAREVTILFPEDVCDAGSWHKFGKYGVHLMAASWRQNGGFFKRRLARLWEGRARRRLEAASRSLGKVRTQAGATLA